MRKNFYSVKEFYQILNFQVSKTTIYNQIKSGKIPVTYIGNCTLIPGYWVEDFCKRCKIEPVEDKDND